MQGGVKPNFHIFRFANLRVFQRYNIILHKSWPYSVCAVYLSLSRWSEGPLLGCLHEKRSIIYHVAFHFLLEIKIICLFLSLQVKRGSLFGWLHEKRSIVYHVTFHFVLEIKSYAYFSLQVKWGPILGWLHEKISIIYHVTFHFLPEIKIICLFWVNHFTSTMVRVDKPGIHNGRSTVQVL